MNAFSRHLKRFPEYLSNGLLAQKILQFLEKFGILIKPFYLIQEGLFESNMLLNQDRFKEYEFVELGKIDMQELDHFDGRETDANELSARLDEQHLCFGLKHNDKIVAFTWCNLNSIHHYAAIERLLESNECYLYDAQTLYVYRGRSLAPYLRFKCYEVLNARGRTRLFSCSAFYNKPAILFKKKLDAKFILIGLDIGIRGLFTKGWVVKKLADYSI